MEKRSVKGLIGAGIIIFSLSGCALLNKGQQLMFLKSFADNQREIESYLKKQEALFDKLVDDVRNDRFKKGTPKDKILSAYGEPIFCKGKGGQTDITETCLWRHPTQYFSTETINLKFDKDRKLSDWEIKPVS